uniref:Fer-1-like protein 4 isoform X1 n=1 Tax=Camelus bactrianus TaxID=9837 RepID=A0A9W3HM69_CAMBA|nr:fer-1-like protein 4 isoform X1 [Camelus bactrianus]
MGNRSQTCPLGAFPIRPGEARLKRRAVALGRRLARSLGQQDDEDNELELELDLEDEPDVELSGVMFSPLKSRAWCLSRGDPFQVSRAQDFQVLLSLQAITLGEYHSPSTQIFTLLPFKKSVLASFSLPSAPFRWGSQCLRPRSWLESTLTPMWLCVLGSNAE